MTERTGIELLFNPGSVAVVGASDKPGKISRIIIESLQASGFKGKVYPVNPAYDTVAGLKCYPSLANIDGGVDLAVFAVPAEKVAGLVLESKGLVRTAIVISGGFGETGGRGSELEKGLRAALKETGIRLVGPNCMGVFNSANGLDTFFIPAEKLARPGAGGVSIISQSGSFAITAMDELAAEGVGVAKVVSYGNMADVNEADCLDYLAEDDATTAVAVYMESVADGRAFVEAAERCSAVKPVMVLKVGKQGAGAAAARSHTGAIAGRYEVYRAAFRKAGVIEAATYEEFIEGCKAFGSGLNAAGRRVAIITDGGGIGVGLADTCVAMGLDVPSLVPDLKDALTGEFPEFFTVSNPLDLTGSVTDELFALAVEKVLASQSFDMAIVAALWGPPGLTDELPGLVRESALASGKPVLVCSPGGAYSKGRMGLWREAGLPVFPSPESAVRAAAMLAGRREMLLCRAEKQEAVG